MGFSPTNGMQKTARRGSRQTLCRGLNGAKKQFLDLLLAYDDRFAAGEVTGKMWASHRMQSTARKDQPLAFALRRSTGVQYTNVLQ